MYQNQNSIDSTSSEKIEEEKMKEIDDLLKEFMNFDFTHQKSLLSSHKEIYDMKEYLTGNNLLILSIETENYNLTKYLLDSKKININSQNKEGDTALHKAIEIINYKLINLLLENNADTNVQNKLNETPLHFAANIGDYKIIKLLLLYKANIYIKNKNNFTAEDCAKMKGFMKCVTILQKKREELENSKEIINIKTNKSDEREKIIIKTSSMPDIDINNINKDIYFNINSNNNINNNNNDNNNNINNNNNDNNNNVVVNGLDEYNSNNRKLDNELNLLRQVTKKDSKILDNLNNNIFNANEEKEKSCFKKITYSNEPDEIQFINNNDNKFLIIENGNELSDIDNNILLYYNNINEEKNIERNSQTEKLPFQLINTLKKNRTKKEKMSEFSLSNKNINFKKSFNHLFYDYSKSLITYVSKPNDISSINNLYEYNSRESKNNLHHTLMKNNTLNTRKSFRNSLTNKNNNKSDVVNIYNEDINSITTNSYNKLNNNNNNNIINKNILNNSSNMKMITKSSKNEEDKKEIYDYLSEFHMEKYTETLINEGFDDVVFITDQMKGKEIITDSYLKNIGISMAGDRAKLLIKFQLDSKDKEFEFNSYLPEEKIFYISNVDSENYKKDKNLIELFEWLHYLKLQKYFTYFFYNGYHSLDLLYMQMLSKNPLTDEILKNDLNINKYGYRLRLMNKLYDDSNKYYNKYSKLSTINSNVVNSEILRDLDLQNEEKKNSFCNCILF